MPGQIDERVKEQRNHDLLAVVDASARRVERAARWLQRGDPLRRAKPDERGAIDGAHPDEQDRRF